MKYYPIGTVVTLKNGDRPILIYGRKQVQADTNLLWDYVACLYRKETWGTATPSSSSRRRSAKSTSPAMLPRLNKRCSRFLIGHSDFLKKVERTYSSLPPFCIRKG